MNRIGYQILEISNYGYCTIRINEPYYFTVNKTLSNRTDIMYETLSACLAWLKNDCGAVKYYNEHSETNETFTVILNGQTIIFLDLAGLPSKLNVVSSFSTEDFCQNVLNAFYSCPKRWMNFPKKTKENDGKDIFELAFEVSTLLDAKKNVSSKWCSLLVEYDKADKVWVVDSYCSGDYDEESIAIAKIARDGKVTYLDADAKTDAKAQEVIRYVLENISDEFLRNLNF